MTDKEIIKALECCIKPRRDCENCPYCKNDECFDMAKGDALNLIVRQKAEIERFKENCSKCGEKTTKTILNLQELLGTARAEAIKEFAERLKNRLKGNGGLFCVTTMNIQIDNLVKEMVGDDK